MPHPTRRKDKGKDLGRKLLDMELSERRRAFTRQKRWGEQAEVARIKQKSARAKSWLEELTFGTFNVRTAAVNGANGIGHIDKLLRPCAANGCDIIGLQETKWDGTFEIGASGYRVVFSGDCSGSMAGRSNMGLHWR